MRLAVRLRPRKKSVRNGLAAGAEWIRTSSSAPDRHDLEHASIGHFVLRRGWFRHSIHSPCFFVPALDRQFEIAIPEVSLSHRLPVVCSGYRGHAYISAREPPWFSLSSL